MIDLLQQMQVCASSNVSARFVGYNCIAYTGFNLLGRTLSESSWLKNSDASLTEKVLNHLSFDINNEDSDICYEAVGFLGCLLTNKEIMDMISFEKQMSIIMNLMELLESSTVPRIVIRTLWSLTESKFNNDIYTVNIDRIGRIISTIMNNFDTAIAQYEGLLAIKFLIKKGQHQMRNCMDIWFPNLFFNLFHDVDMVRREAFYCFSTCTATAEVDKSFAVGLNKILISFIPQLRAKYCHKMVELVSEKCRFTLKIWRLLIATLGQVLHNGSMEHTILINGLLSVVQKAFTSCEDGLKVEAFKCWHELIDNYSVDYDILTHPKRLVLLLLPLKNKDYYAQEVASAKFYAWWHLIYKLESIDENYFNLVIVPFLEFSFDSALSASNFSEGSQAIHKDSLDEYKVTIEIIFIEALSQIIFIGPSPSFKIYNNNVISHIKKTIMTPKIFVQHQKLLFSCITSSLITLNSGDAKYQGLGLFLLESLMRNINFIIEIHGDRDESKVVVKSICNLISNIKAYCTPGDSISFFLLKAIELSTTGELALNNDMISSNYDLSDMLSVREFFEQILFCPALVQYSDLPGYTSIWSSLLKSGPLNSKILFCVTAVQKLSKLASLFGDKNPNVLARLWFSVAELADLYTISIDADQWSCIHEILIFPFENLRGIMYHLDSLLYQDIVHIWTSLWNQFSNQVNSSQSMEFNSETERMAKTMLGLLQKDFNSIWSDEASVTLEFFADILDIMIRKFDFMEFSEKLELPISITQIGNISLENLDSCIHLLGFLMEKTLMLQISEKEKGLAKIYMLSTNIFKDIACKEVSWAALDALTENLKLIFEVRNINSDKEIIAGFLWDVICRVIENQLNTKSANDKLKRISPLIKIGFRSDCHGIRERTNRLWTKIKDSKIINVQIMNVSNENLEVMEDVKHSLEKGEVNLSSLSTSKNFSEMQVRENGTSSEITNILPKKKYRVQKRHIEEAEDEMEAKSKLVLQFPSDDDPGVINATVMRKIDVDMGKHKLSTLSNMDLSKVDDRSLEGKIYIKKFPLMEERNIASTENKKQDLINDSNTDVLTAKSSKRGSVEKSPDMSLSMEIEFNTKSPILKVFNVNTNSQENDSNENIFNEYDMDKKATYVLEKDDSMVSENAGQCMEDEYKGLVTICTSHMPLQAGLRSKEDTPLSTKSAYQPSHIKTLEENSIKDKLCRNKPTFISRCSNISDSDGSLHGEEKVRSPNEDKSSSFTKILDLEPIDSTKYQLSNSEIVPLKKKLIHRESENIHNEICNQEILNEQHLEESFLNCEAKDAILNKKNGESINGPDIKLMESKDSPKSSSKDEFNIDGNLPTRRLIKRCCFIDISKKDVHKETNSRDSQDYELKSAVLVSNVSTKFQSNDKCDDKDLIVNNSLKCLPKKIYTSDSSNFDSNSAEIISDQGVKKLLMTKSTKGTLKETIFSSKDNLDEASSTKQLPKRRCVLENLKKLLDDNEVDFDDTCSNFSNSSKNGIEQFYSKINPYNSSSGQQRKRLPRSCASRCSFTKLKGDQENELSKNSSNEDEIEPPVLNKLFSKYEDLDSLLKSTPKKHLSKRLMSVRMKVTKVDISSKLAGTSQSDLTNVGVNLSDDSLCERGENKELSGTEGALSILKKEIDSDLELHYIKGNEPTLIDSSQILTRAPLQKHTQISSKKNSTKKYPKRNNGATSQNLREENFKAADDGTKSQNSANSSRTGSKRPLPKPENVDGLDEPLTKKIALSENENCDRIRDYYESVEGIFGFKEELLSTHAKKTNKLLTEFFSYQQKLDKKLAYKKTATVSRIFRFVALNSGKSISEFSLDLLHYTETIKSYFDAISYCGIGPSGVKVKYKKSTRKEIDWVLEFLLFLHTATNDKNYDYGLKNYRIALTDLISTLEQLKKIKEEECPVKNKKVNICESPMLKETYVKLRHIVENSEIWDHIRKEFGFYYSTACVDSNKSLFFLGLLILKSILFKSAKPSIVIKLKMRDFVERQKYREEALDDNFYHIRIDLSRPGGSKKYCTLSLTEEEEHLYRIYVAKFRKDPNSTGLFFVNLGMAVRLGPLIRRIQCDFLNIFPPLTVGQIYDISGLDISSLPIAEHNDSNLTSGFSNTGIGFNFLIKNECRIQTLRESALKIANDKFNLSLMDEFPTPTQMEEELRKSIDDPEFDSKFSRKIYDAFIFRYVKLKAKCFLDLRGCLKAAQEMDRKELVSYMSKVSGAKEWKSKGRIANAAIELARKINHKDEPLFLSLKSDYSVLVKHILAQDWIEFTGLAIRHGLDDRGSGVFTATNVSKGQIVCDLNGTFIEKNAEQYFSKALKSEHIFHFRYHSSIKLIDASIENSSIGKLINHSFCCGNVEPIILEPSQGEDHPHILFEAKYDIEPDVEILYAYSRNAKESGWSCPICGKCASISKKHWLWQ